LPFNLNAHTSFWTSVSAAEIFWGIFAAGVVLGIVLLLRKPRERPRRRSRYYDLPPETRQASPPSEIYIWRPDAQAARGDRLRR
jgi:hypothetical protein